MFGNMLCGKFARPSELREIKYSELKQWHKWLMIDRKNLETHTEKAELLRNGIQ